MPLGQVEHGIRPQKGLNMPCYHPKLRVENKHIFCTAIDGHKYYKATIEAPDNINERLEELRHHPEYNYTIIPCRNCIGCRLEYSRDWANRGYLESKYYKENYFVTLTYDEDHIIKAEEMTTSEGITYTDDEDNWNGILVPKDLEKFIKNLRREMKRKYNTENIRYMACGEYGTEGKRPHYHLIFFNLQLPPETFYKTRIINKEYYWQNTIIERCWKHGISNISICTWNNIAYTARYITKKINGKGSEDEYASKGQIKEFFRMSKGIGRQYYEDHKEEIYKRDEIIIKNKSGTIRTKPPKYYDKLYEKEFPEKFEEIKKKRKRLRENNDKIKDQQISITRLERLAINERSHEERHKKLLRLFEAGK